MNGLKEPLLSTLLAFFVIALVTPAHATSLTAPDGIQIAQSDDKKPKPEPAEEEHNDEDDC